MKPSDLLAPRQLLPFSTREYGVFVDLRADGLGVSFVSRHLDKHAALKAAEAARGHYPGDPVQVLCRPVRYEPWDEVVAVPGAPCCDMHNVHCEPPSELCCGFCTEVRHPKHGPGVVCVLDEARAAAAAESNALETKQ